ncbi:MAG: metallophosphoesterase family protein [Eubacterium sp.]|jgi:predicted MPP superfamily phosphohydrolase|nr:metallophosphoesterase family protein [Eubacterium sp.]
MKKYLLFAMFLSIYYYTKLKITKYAIKSEKIKRSMRIALLADLHSVSYGKNQHELLRLISAQSPDIIVMSGDMVDDRFDNIRSYQIMSDLAKKYLCFYVTGNHEHRTKQAEEIKETLKSFGIYVLDGKGAKLKGNIRIFGVDDREGDAIEFKRQHIKVYRTAKFENFNILLQHKPEFISIFKKSNFDLMLCGHTHGGQVGIPMFNSALYANGQGFFPKYFGGMHKFYKNNLIISRGLTRNTRGIPRLFNPNELVVIDLSPKYSYS